MSFDWLSNWNLIRTSGFLAYFLFTFSIVAGLMNRLFIFQKQKQLMLELHKISGWTGMLTVVFHATLLLVDTYVPYQIWGNIDPIFSRKCPGLFCTRHDILLFIFADTSYIRFFHKNIRTFIMEKASLSCYTCMDPDDPPRHPHWNRFCSTLGCLSIWWRDHSGYNPTVFSVFRKPS